MRPKYTPEYENKILKPKPSLLDLTAFLAATNLLTKKLSTRPNILGGAALLLAGSLLATTLKNFYNYHLEVHAEIPPPPKEGKVETILNVYAAEDENGALSLDPMQSAGRKNLEGLTALEQKHRVVSIIANTKQEITETAAALAKRGIVISDLILDTHGSKDRIHLGTGESIYSLERKDVPGLKKNSRILISGCSTGEPTGIAERISKAFPTSTIYAPTKSATNRVFLDSQGRPAILNMDWSTKKIVTNTIQNGVSTPFFPIREVGNPILTDYFRTFYDRHIDSDPSAYELCLKAAAHGDTNAMYTIAQYEERKGNRDAASAWMKSYYSSVYASGRSWPLSLLTRT